MSHEKVDYWTSNLSLDGLPLGMNMRQVMLLSASRNILGIRNQLDLLNGETGNHSDPGIRAIHLDYPEGVRGIRSSLSRLARSLTALHRATLMAVLMLVTAFAGDLAMPRSDSNSQAAHLKLLEKARQGGIDIYFEGDSITRRWGTSDPEYSDLLANWKQNFFGWNAADFGWGGDTVQNILWRVENGELDGVHPKIIVLMAGTNNLGKDNAVTVTTITRGIRAILNAMRQKAPGAVIILMGITPRKELMSVINEVNAEMAGFADGKNIRYLNINDRLQAGATVDGLHLSVKGYQIWADALQPIFRELLGPPGETDHAPPPTGDPRIRPQGAI